MSDPTLETNSLLLRTIKSDNKSVSWLEFRDLYEPLIRRRLNGHGIQIQDIEDLTQNVLTVVVRRIDEFEHQKRTGCFRAWLKQICTYCLREYWRTTRNARQAGFGKSCQEILAELEDEHSALSVEWNREHDQHVVNKLLEKVRQNFAETTNKAFVETYMKGRSISEVARELDISENAVFIARSRVLDSLKSICEGIVDLDEFV